MKSRCKQIRQLRRITKSRKRGKTEVGKEMTGISSDNNTRKKKTLDTGKLRRKRRNEERI